MRVHEDAEESDEAKLAKATPWPLAKDMFERVLREKWIVVALDRPQVLAIVGSTGTAGIRRHDGSAIAWCWRRSCRGCWAWTIAPRSRSVP